MGKREKKEKLSSVLADIPHKPGVYRYYSQIGELLYVGKAKDLKKRVSSYFQTNKVHNQRTHIMVNQIERIEYTLVGNEAEALLLEANLIHSLQPRFNVLLRDEQNYLYVRFTYGDEIPRICLERKKTSPKYTYYGPFFSRNRISEILRAVRMVLPYCEKNKYDGKPCEYVSIGRCDGICIHKETMDDYLARLKQIENLFVGKTEEVENYIQNKITHAVSQQLFESAGFWRDRLQLLRDMFKRDFGHQKMVLPAPDDLDIVTLVTESDETGGNVGSVFVQSIRGGKMVNVNNFLFTGSEIDETQSIVTEYLERFLKSYYIFQQTRYPVLVQAFHHIRDEG